MRLFFSILGICFILVWAFRSISEEMAKQALRTSTETVEARIIDLSCGRRAFIHFRFKAEEYKTRIYLDSDECAELRKRQSIKLKFDNDGVFIFANPSYNDWSETEVYATYAIAIISVLAILWYQIFPYFRSNMTRKQ